MKFKGIVLAGGTGSRLNPLTKSVSKHLLPIYNKPLIYYPISVIMLLNIKDILIVSDEYNLPFYKKLLGNGEKFGVNFQYVIQDNPKGIPDALIAGETFIRDSKVALILGDNFFYGQGISEIINKAKNNFKGSQIFCYKVINPSNFGVALIKNKKIISIKEKPKKLISNLAISGLYFFDNKVFQNAKKLKLSKRKELEITKLLEIYNKQKKLDYVILGRGVTWLDTGSADGLLNASNFVYNIEKRQGFNIACLEEIAFSKKWISRKNLKKIINENKNSEYNDYLKSLIK
jgi:glucose-1-phosphate thymidylyltransferase